MAFGIELKEVFINKLSEGIFYSELLFDREGEMARIDSRTSDAVALALRYKCPIYTTPEILEQAGIILEDKADMLDPEVETDTASEPSGLSSKSAEELNMLLEEAVTNEDYETASEIRDELKRRHKKA